MHRVLKTVVCLLTLPRLALLEASPHEPNEGPPLLFAKDLLSEEHCLGEWHKVEPIVQVRNFGYLFRVKSEFGDFEVMGREAMEECVREIEAIARLNEISQAEAFATSVSSKLTEPVLVTVGVARRPVSTVVGLPTGIGRYLQGKLYQARKSSGKAISKIRKGKNNGQASETKGEATEDQSRSVAESVANSTDKLSKRHLGYSESKRIWAQRLGVNPYSDNMVLQEALGRIAWTSSLGEFTGGFAAPVSEAFSYASKARKYAWEYSPTELERANGILLKKLGVSKETIRAFSDSPAYSLSQKTEIALIVESLSAVEGMEKVLEMMLLSETEGEARFLVKTLAILEDYRREVSSIQELSIRSGLIVAVGENGYMILPLAVDYLHWDPLISEAINSEDFENDKREIWISGTISPVARGRLRELRWYVVEECLGDKAQTASSQFQKRSNG